MELAGGGIAERPEMPMYDGGDFWRGEDRPPEEEARMSALALAHRASLHKISRSQWVENKSRLAKVLRSRKLFGLGSHRPTGTCRKAGDVLMFETAQVASIPGAEHEMRTWYGFGQCDVHRVAVQWGAGMEIVITAQSLPDGRPCWHDDSVELFQFWLSQSEQRPYTTAAHLRYLEAIARRHSDREPPHWLPEDLTLRQEIFDGHLELAMRAIAARKSSGRLF